jgi:hypothetical protein
MDFDAHLCGHIKKCFAIVTGKIGDGAYRELSTQDGIGEARDVAHVYACAHDGAAFGDMAQCLRQQVACGRENNGSIQFYRWRSRGIPCPNSPQFAGETPGIVILRFGESNTSRSCQRATWAMMWAAEPNEMQMRAIPSTAAHIR